MFFYLHLKFYCQNAYLMNVYKKNKNEIIVFLMCFESIYGLALKITK